MSNSVSKQGSALSISKAREALVKSGILNNEMEQLRQSVQNSRGNVANLMLVQGGANHSYMKEGSDVYDPNIKEGDMVIVWGANINNIVDRTHKALDVIPVKFFHTYSEYDINDQEIANWGRDDTEFQKTKWSTNNVLKKSRHFLEEQYVKGTDREGNHIAKVWRFYVLFNYDGKWERGKVSMRKSSRNAGRDWVNRMSGMLIRDKDGQGMELLPCDKVFKLAVEQGNGRSLVWRAIETEQLTINLSGADAIYTEIGDWHKELDDREEELFGKNVTPEAEYREVENTVNDIPI